VEVVPLKTSSSVSIIIFLEDNILTRFGVPQKLTNDNDIVLRSIEFISFYSYHGITLVHANNYYPHENGLA
jgi:hypothetical protein